MKFPHEKISSDQAHTLTTELDAPLPAMRFFEQVFDWMAFGRQTGRLS